MFFNIKHFDIMRKTYYSEKTNVLAYYVLTLILLFNYQSFIEWCNKSNLSLFQFNKTTPNLTSFCNFIEKYYENSTLLKNIECVEKYYDNLKKKNDLWKLPFNKSNKEFLFKTLRMTATELK